MRLSGRLVGLFSFDVGYEIRLDAVPRPAGSVPGTIGRRHSAPVHLAYATPPLRIPLSGRRVHLAGRESSATTSAWLHEFGAATVLIEVPLECDATDLPALAGSLTSAALEEAARGLLGELRELIAPAVERPESDGTMEDYFVLVVERFEPGGDIEHVLAACGPQLASAVRGEPGALSPGETAAILGGAIRYTADDLLLADWNIAIVHDPGWPDALAVLEFLNVQLVELRYYDALLDRRIAELAPPERLRPRPFPLIFARGHHRAIEELATVRIDMAKIFERIHNALKLGGDVYLARVYAQTAQRLGLEAWERSVARKLEVLQEIYEVLVQRAATARAEALEATIVVLILLEIALSLRGAR